MEPLRLVRVALILASGCSLALNGPDPNRPRGQVPTCDVGKGRVAADGIAAAGFAIGGVASANDSKGAATVLIALGAVYALSALHGSNVTGECRADFNKYALESRPQLDDRAAVTPAVNVEQSTSATAAEPAPAMVTEAPKPAAAVMIAPAPAAATPAAPAAPAASEPPPEPAKPVKPPPRPEKKQQADKDWSQFWQETP